MISETERALRIFYPERFAPLPRGYKFKCSACGNVYEYEEDLPPLCTGPGWTNDHEPELMTFVGRFDSTPSIVVPGVPF